MPRRRPAPPPAAGPAPRWLSAAEQAAWLPLAALMVRLPAALDAQIQRDAGLSHFEYMVLSRLSEADRHTLRMSQLAVLASGSLSRLSHTVSRLEQRGWIRRVTCPGDGRATNAVLTPAGYAVVVARAPGHVARVRELVIDALTPTQLEQLRVIATTVLDRIESA